MRCISRSAGFKMFPITSEDDIATGRPKKRGIIAAFTQHIPIEEWEYAEAKRRFSFPGGNLEDDGDSGGAAVDPIGRISVFDTDYAAKNFGWSPETKAEVEQFFVDMASIPGNQDFFIVEKPAAKKPWESYDDFTDPAKIAAFVVEGGFDPILVAAYESENQKREKVLAALSKLNEQEKPVVVSA